MSGSSVMRRLFEEACGLGPEERDRFLRESCDADDRRQIEEMLELLDSNPEFLCAPAIDEALWADAMEEAQRDEPMPERIGRYTIVRRLGEGGMGVVYEAMQDSPRRTVAIKVVSAVRDDARSLARFELEAEALARLRHVGIAQVYEAGTFRASSGVRGYIAMEFVSGVPIGDYARGKPVGLRLELIAQVCEAIAHAHRHGVVHRDIKSANVLIDAEGRVRVLDFGIAHLAGSGVWARGGTLGAMSPEAMEESDGGTKRRSDEGVDAGGTPPPRVCRAGKMPAPLEMRAGRPPPRGEATEGRKKATERRSDEGEEPEPSEPESAHSSARADTRQDVYALGALAYQVLAGCPAHDLRGLSMAEASARVRAAPMPLGDIEPACRGDVEAIVAMAMAIDPDDRYKSVSRMAEDIRRHMRGETVSARPQTFVYQASRLVGRHRGVFAAVGLAVLALVLGTVGTTWGLARSLHQQGLTHAALADAQRVIESLEGILKAPDPRRMGRDAKVTDLLASAEASLDRRFADSPLVAASLRYTIGTTYHALGELEKARTLLTDALAVRRGRLGEDDPRTLDTMHALAWTLTAMARYDEAEPMLRTVVAARRRVLGPTNRDTLTSMHALALLLDETGRYDEAGALLATLSVLAHDALEADDPLLLTVRNCMANVYVHQGDLEAAAALHRQVLEDRRRILGDRHPDTLQSINNLAGVLSMLGRDDEAVVLLEEALATGRAIYGENHPKALQTAENLAAVYRRLGRTDEALSLMTWTLEHTRAALGPAHPHTIIAMGNLGALYARAGRMHEAAQLFHDAVEAAIESMGEDHPTLALLRIALARTLTTMGRFEEAERALDAAWRVLSQSPASDGALQCARTNVALYEAWGRAREAALWRERAGSR